MTQFTEEEKTIRRIERRFSKGAVQYGLIEEGDKILIGLSGGKDSLALVELLGRGRAKKGIFEGDLEEGELEIGQVAALFRRRQSVDEVMKELLEGYRRASDKIRSAGL